MTRLWLDFTEGGGGDCDGRQDPSDTVLEKVMGETPQSLGNEGNDCKVVEKCAEEERGPALCH